MDQDYVKEFDYYSPVIIANNDYLKRQQRKSSQSHPSHQKATNMPKDLGEAADHSSKMHHRTQR